jgi:hypothetical protein
MKMKKKITETLNINLFHNMTSCICVDDLFFFSSNFYFIKKKYNTQPNGYIYLGLNLGIYNRRLFSY